MIRLFIGRNFGLLLIAILLFACNSDETAPSELANEISLIGELKSRLSAVQAEQQIITDVDRTSRSGRDLFVLTVDNIEQLLVSASLITSVDYDLDAWRITFTFNDSSELTTYAVGERILRDGFFSITPNPSGFAPLTAEADINMPLPGTFTVTVIG